MFTQPQVISPPGVYTITTPAPTTVTYTDTSVTFSWAPAPAPVPPQPQPQPSPPVLTGHVWALLVYDPAVTLPVAQQAVISSATLRASALSKDVDIQSFQMTDPAIASWVPKLPTTGLPALLLVQKTATGTGVLAYSVALPDSGPDFMSLVDKVRGN